MKNIKRKYIVATAILILSVAVAGIGAAYAAEGVQGTNPMSDLVSAIASKFNLNVSDVQAVFDAQKTKMQAHRQQSFTDRINQAVTAGKLTQAQATAILSKKAELDALQTSLWGKTAQERAMAMQNFQASLKQWATDNNIPAGYMFFGVIGGGKMAGARGTFGTVVSNSNGTIMMNVTQPGSTTPTVYTVTAASGATIKKVTKGTDISVKPTSAAITFDQIATGDTILVRGSVTNNTISATAITDGAAGMGMGHGRGGHMFGRMIK
jgi:hypothetical protein